MKHYFPITLPPSKSSNVTNKSLRLMKRATKI